METKFASAMSNLKKPELTHQAAVDYSPDIIVSDDEQMAYISLKQPPEGSWNFSYNELLSALEKKKVVSGLKTDVLHALEQNPVYGEMTLVAQGEVPEQGTDAKLEYHFTVSREIKPKEREDGTVDYRDLGLIESVVIDQKLCTLTPAMKGINGKTVTGRVILAEPVRNLVMPIGRNTKLSEDKLMLLSSINGSVEYTNGRVTVSDVFSVNGDVSNATGNINFDGSVVVHGDVLTGFSVKATGNITVIGNVENAYLEAGGSIKISAGLVGRSRGRAVCGGSFKAFFVENAEVLAYGDVIADVFMHSQVKCGGSLLADGKRGTIVGGYYVVAKDVKALVVGAPGGVATTFEMGIDPTIIERVKFINERIRIINAESVKLNQIIQLLSPMKAAGKLAPDKVDVFEKALTTKDSRDVELAELTAECESQKAGLRAVPSSQLICKKELYSGTKVSIGPLVYVVPSDLLRCKIRVNASREIEMSSL